MSSYIIDNTLYRNISLRSAQDIAFSHGENEFYRTNAAGDEAKACFSRNPNKVNTWFECEFDEYEFERIAKRTAGIPEDED